MNVPAILFTAVSIFATLVAALCWFETYLLFTNQHPITWWTRRSEILYQGPFLVLAILAALAIGLLLGHFVWDRDYNGDTNKPEGRN